MATPELIKTILTSPEAVVWEGEAVSITSKNSEGLFDLFPDHARFMTLLEDVDVSIELPNGDEQVFHIEKAVLLFQDATAKIYLHKHISPKPRVGKVEVKKA
jgi:F0F1-type ATP synthase epsilon subunit